MTLYVWTHIVYFNNIHLSLAFAILKFTHNVTERLIVQDTQIYTHKD